MIVDKTYCMSSFLMFRTIVDRNKCFAEGMIPQIFDLDFSRIPITNSDELYDSLKSQVEESTRDGKAALALSGGIDSAILAKFMPKGSTAYTFKCIVPGVEVTDETKAAAKYAEECGLKHKVVEIYWEDFERYSPILMKHKGAPIHSIEVQIYKAALQAKIDGFDKMLFGENADIIYGGMNGLLQKDWLFGEFVDRYTYVKPYHILKSAEIILEPYRKYEIDGHIDGHQFINDYFREEALKTYKNASDTAKMKLIVPYAKTYLNTAIDYNRIRTGDAKYLVREVFNRLYPGLEIPPKTPMPRPMNEWLKDWEGPKRDEFWPHCTDNMTGDQKWLVWVLEKFLDMIEK